MDFRTPRPPERPAVPRSEPTPTPPPVEPEPKKETPRTVQHIGNTHHIPKEEKSKKRFVLPILIVIVVIILGISAFVALTNKNGGSGIDSSKYQAVFFTNGQVYFGKLQSFNDDYMKMTDIFYLQTQETETDTDKKNPQETSTDQNSNVQLIKLGNEVHGPEDSMIISRDQVLFYENLKNDGKVATTIKQYKEK